MKSSHMLTFNPSKCFALFSALLLIVHYLDSAWILETFSKLNYNSGQHSTTQEVVPPTHTVHRHAVELIGDSKLPVIVSGWLHVTLCWTGDLQCNLASCPNDR